VFRAGVTIVRVDAQVINGRQVVADLDQSSFRVFDEGVEQPIEYFGRDSEPLSLLLLLDVSGSMKRRLQEMAAVSRRALDALHDGDRVAVVVAVRNETFDAGPRRVLLDWLLALLRTTSNTRGS